MLRALYYGLALRRFAVAERESFIVNYIFLFSDTIVVHIKNAQHDSASISLPGSSSTAVTDVDEHSYSKMTFGGMDDRAGYPTLLQGSAVDFAMCFSVPKTEKLDSFVYQVYPGGSKPPTFRVSLAPLNELSSFRAHMH